MYVDTNVQNKPISSRSMEKERLNGYPPPPKYVEKTPKNKATSSLNSSTWYGRTTQNVCGHKPEE